MPQPAAVQKQWESLWRLLGCPISQSISNVCSGGEQHGSEWSLLASQRSSCCWEEPSAVQLVRVLTQKWRVSSAGWGNAALGSGFALSCCLWKCSLSTSGQFWGPDLFSYSRNVALSLVVWPQTLSKDYRCPFVEVVEATVAVCRASTTSEESFVLRGM